MKYKIQIFNGNYSKLYFIYIFILKIFKSNFFIINKV